MTCCFCRSWWFGSVNPNHHKCRGSGWCLFTRHYSKCLITSFSEIDQWQFLLIYVRATWSWKKHGESTGKPDLISWNLPHALINAMIIKWTGHLSRVNSSRLPTQFYSLFKDRCLSPRGQKKHLYDNSKSWGTHDTGDKTEEGYYIGFRASVIYVVYKACPSNAWLTRQQQFVLQIASCWFRLNAIPIWTLTVTY